MSLVLQKSPEEMNAFKGLTNWSVETAAMVKTNHDAEVCEGFSVRCPPQGTNFSSGTEISRKNECFQATH